MNTMRVVDIYGRNCIVDESKRELVSYSNQECRIEWRAPIMDGIHETGCWANYIVAGKIYNDKTSII